jgi:predicted small lipoprotein YifL
MKPVIRTLSLAAVLALTLTACGLLGGGEPTPAPVATDPGVSQPVVLPTAAPGNPCANEFYPVKLNATWFYISSGSPSGSYQLLNTITEVRPDGFTLTSQFRKKPRVQTWDCRSEGLAATQLIADNATSIAAFEKFPTIKASNISGVNIPVTITPGMEWTYAFDISGTEGRKGAPGGAMTGRIASTFLAGNKESVTVPAGTFDAIPIEVNTVIDFTVQDAAGTVTLTLDSSYTYWYVPGIGWVKATGYGKLGGQDYFETIEMNSYTIP